MQQGSQPRLQGTVLQRPCSTTACESTGDFLALAAREPETAREALYEHALRLAPASCRRAGLRREISQDLATEVYVRAAADDWASLRRVGHTIALGAWVWACLVNVAHEKQREERKHRLPVAASSANVPAHPEQTDAASDARRLGDRMAPDLWGALTLRQAQAFRACAEGLGVPAIARLLGISRAAVRDRLRRGIVRARAALGGTATASVRILLAAEQPRSRRQLTRDEALVRRRWNDGAPLAAIAAEIGRTPQATRSLVRRLRTLLEGCATMASDAARDRSADPPTDPSVTTLVEGLDGPASSEGHELDMERTL